MFAVIQSLGAEMVVMGLNVLTGMVTARLLGPDGRGIFVAITLWQQLLAMLAIAGLQSTVIYHSRKAPADSSAIAGTSIAAAFVAATGLIAVGVFVVPTMMTRYPIWAVTAAQLCLLVTYLNILQMMMKQTFAARDAFGAFNLLNVLSPVFFLAALGVAAMIAPMTATTAAAALAAAAIFGPLTMFPTWLRVVRPRLVGIRDVWHRISGYTYRSSGADVVVALAAYMDRLILLPMVSEAALGLYVVAFSFSRLLLVLLPAINSVVFSSMADRGIEQMRTLHDRAFRLALAASVGALAVLWAVAEPLIVLVYGSEFETAGPLFRILAAEASLTLLTSISMRYLLALGLAGVATGLQVGGLAVSSALIVALVPDFGVLGAAWGVTVASAIKLAMLLGYLALKGYGRVSPILSRADIAYVRDKLR